MLQTTVRKHMHGEDVPQSEKIGPMLQSAYQLPLLKEESTALESYLGVVEHETRAGVDRRSTRVRRWVRLLSGVKLERLELGLPTSSSCNRNDRSSEKFSFCRCAARKARVCYTNSLVETALRHSDGIVSWWYRMRGRTELRLDITAHRAAL